jgi:hypothetical protein
LRHDPFVPAPPADHLPPDRELHASAYAAAPVEEVWAVLSDVRRMPELSPELVRMVALRPGGLRVGQQYLGVNRRGVVVWPTRNVVADLDPGRLLAWDTPTSGARWVWELAAEGTGTRIVHRRPLVRRTPWVSRQFATAFLGGVAGHADELEEGMAVSAARLARLVEAAHLP